MCHKNVSEPALYRLLVHLCIPTTAWNIVSDLSEVRKGCRTQGNMYQLVGWIQLKVRSVTPSTQLKDPVKVKLVQEDLKENEIIKSALGSYQKFKKSCPSQNHTSFLVNCSLINTLILETKNKAQRWTSYGCAANFVWNAFNSMQLRISI